QTDIASSANLLQIVAQPAMGQTSATAFSPAFAVAVLDASNRLIAIDNDTLITASVASTGSGVFLTGQTAVKVIDGIARFENTATSLGLGAIAPSGNFSIKFEAAVTFLDGSTAVL